MSYNGSGTFLINSSGQPVVTGTTISSTAFNALTSDLATGLSTAITKDGQTTPTAHIPLGGFKLTGVGAATARTDAMTLANAQDGTGVYVATVGGTADAITLAPSPAIAAYAAGQAFYWIASGANTTTVTLAVSGLASPKAVTKNGSTALVAGDIPSGALVGARYDGTRFQLIGTGAATSQLLSTIAAAGDFYVGNGAGTTTNLPAAATVAAHATTSNIWSARYVTLSGSVVTFTDVADAPFAGAVSFVVANAAHVLTDGANIEVQGNANYTCVSGDVLVFYAKTTSTFQVSILRENGVPISMLPITNSISGDVALNNTGTFFTGPTVAQGTVGTWFASGQVTCLDTAGIAAFSVQLTDGTTVIASGRGDSVNSSNCVVISLSGYIANPAGNIRITVKDVTSTSGAIKFNATGLSKDSTVTAIRIA